MYTQHIHKNTFALFLSFEIKPDLPEQWKEACLTNLILQRNLKPLTLFFF